MFINSLQGFLLGGDESEVPESTDPSAWSYSFERQAVVAAVREGSDEAINRALEQLFVRMSPVDPQLQRLAGSHRSARRLQAVDRFQAWAETERQGRTVQMREETVRLNRLLRSWFTNVAVSADDAGITIRASRRSLHGEPRAITTDAYIDLREWARNAPRTQRRHLANRRWSQSEIIGSLQAWAAYHGRSPEYADWRYAGPYNPSALTVRKSLGSWPEALRIAGLDPTYPKPAPYNTRRWSDIELITVIRSWTEMHGRRPMVADWRYADAKHPSPRDRAPTLRLLPCCYRRRSLKVDDHPAAPSVTGGSLSWSTAISTAVPAPGALPSVLTRLYSHIWRGRLTIKLETHGEQADTVNP
jgi:Homing endonuclease associated repeat